MVENFYLLVDAYNTTLSDILKILFKMMKNICSYVFCANSDRSTRLSYANTFMLKGSPCTFLPHLHLILHLSSILIRRFSPRYSLNSRLNFLRI